MISVGLLYSCKDFLALTATSGLSSAEFTKHFKTYRYSTSEKILDVSVKSGWIKINPLGFLKITKRGSDIHNNGYKDALLLQLEDYILNYNPSWASLLPKGRKEAKNFLPSDVNQCFKEAGLYEQADDSIIRYWDNLSLAYRNYAQKRMLELGRTGEKLSFEFEHHRTGIKPIWQAFESNLSGFDILSQVDSSNNGKLLIEVKSTSAGLNIAELHISKYEWNTSLASLNYIFHLWHSINVKPTLHVVTCDEMAKHIPVDSNFGEWELVKIPFDVLAVSSVHVI